MQAQGRGTSAWVCFSWESVPVSGPIPLGASLLQRLNLPSPRKEKKIAQNKKPDPDFKNKLFFCLMLKGKRCGGERREKPRAAALGPVPSPGGGRAGGGAGRRAGASRTAPFLGLHCPLSRGRRIAPPALLASFRAEPAAEGLRGQHPGSSPGHPLSPPDSDGQQNRDTRCWLPGGDQSPVWSVFK